MKNIFNGKVVWVTGASSGIGEALVYAFTERGATVIASSNQPEELERVKSNCSGRGGNVICAPFDLSDTEKIIEVVYVQIAKTGTVDFLINIGGISQRATIMELSLIHISEPTRPY